MNIEFREVDNLKQAYPIMKELRPKLTFEDFISIYNEARLANQYTLVGVFLKEECLALMGYRLLFDYVHGKHLYIDDLITTSTQRSKGLGAKLLLKAEEIARNANCKYLRLSTGIENNAAKEFYEREGLKLRAVVYKKTL